MFKNSISFKGIKQLAQYNKKYIPLLTLQIFFSVLTPYFQLWMSAEIVTALYEGSPKKEIYSLVLITLLGSLFIHIMGAWLRHIVEKQNKIWSDNEMLAFNSKVLNLDYDKMESVEIRDHRSRIEYNSYINYYGSKRLMIVVQSGINVILNILLSMVMFGEMLVHIINAGFKPVSIVLFIVLLVLVVISILCNSYIQKKKGIYFNEIGDLMLDENRMYRGEPSEYAGKDVRLYNLREICISHLKKLTRHHFKVNSGVRKKIFLLELPALVISSLIQAISYVIVCLYCVMGTFAIGSIIKYVAYLTRMISGIGSLFAIYADMKSNEPFLKEYLDFFDIKNDMYQGSLSVEKRSDKKYDIEFKNVSFKYPGSDNYALKDINLSVKVGERLAVVGMNGSGKTTFIKLMCRLYDPSEGEVLMNDFNIRKYDYRQYLDIFSVVFQDYRLLALPLGTNIATSSEWDSVKIENLLDKVGFMERYKEMPQKLDTPIYKDFDNEGVNLSGGEAQKIALARALYKDAPFIILDEPTAALDPIAEAEIYSKFDSIVGDKTAIYISHRLSSCRFCDKIAVFDEGRIVQVGTHDELVKDTNGKYYELWNAQAQYYTEEGVAV